jgi:HAMP domain-containing protein
MATRSGGGVLYALILFVFLFIFSLALAILFYSQKLQVEEQVAEYNDLREDFVSNTERQLDEFQTALTDRGDQTVYGHLSSEIKTLKRRLMGQESASMQQIEDDLKSVNVTPGQNALGEIRKLASEVAGLKEQIVSKEQAIEETARAVNQLEAKLTTLTTTSKQKIDALNTALDDRSKEWQQFEQASDGERKEVVARLEQARKDGQARIREKNTEIRELNAEINRLSGRISELTAIVEASRPSAPDMTLESDGRVVDVDPRESVVFINLGRNDRLILGMTFEVFDATTGVQTEITQNGRRIHTGGKAKIEVIRFSDSGETAICRVVRKSYGQPVVSGDLISNIVYDKNRTFRFFVYGDFDLNQDGFSTPIERERIENLIKQWGGEVIDADELPVDTDFLVLGENVQYPEPLPQNPPPTQAQVDEWQARVAEFKRYAELTGLATELSIPVLNQNRFLTLIGFYEN